MVAAQDFLCGRRAAYPVEILESLSLVQVVLLTWTAFEVLITNIRVHLFFPVTGVGSDQRVDTLIAILTPLTMAVGERAGNYG